MSKREGLTITNSQQKNTHLRNIVTFLMSGLLLLSLSACFKTNNTPAQVQEQTGSSSSSLDTTNTNGDIDEWLIPLLSEYLADEPVDPCLDIQFPDANLLAGLRATPEIPDSGPITCAHMESLTDFRYDGDVNRPESEKIVDITGLNYAVNLTRLLLGGNNITTIAPGFFASFSKLTALDLNQNKLESIDSRTFSGLSDLTFLRLRLNQIQNIESGSFASLTKLESLELGSNKLNTIEKDTFADLTSLTDLSLSNNQIKRIDKDFFSVMPKLTHLNLSGNQLTDLSALQDLSYRNLNFGSLTVNNNCLNLNKVTTKGVLENLSAITGIFLKDGNPKAGCAIAKQPQSSTNFDLDANLFDATEDWTAKNVFDLTVTHSPTGGQVFDGGFIQVDNSGSFNQTIPYFVAPQQYYGDASDYKNGLLSFYLKSDVVTSPTLLYTFGNISITGGNPAKTLSYSFDSSRPAASNSWEYYAVRLSPDGWIVNNSPATDADMNEVLADLNELRIHGLNGSSTTGLDTVVMQKGYTSSPNAAIPDNDSEGVANSLVVPATESASIEDLNVWVDISHTWVGDLTLSLKKLPSGPTVTLLNRPLNSSCSGGNLSTIFDDDATLEIQNNCEATTPAYSAKTVFEPIDDLSAFSTAGVPVNGLWELTVTDTISGDTGTLNSWGLFFK